MSFRIDMLPAERGDCIWIEYGAPAKPHRVLIDGAPLVSFNHLRGRIEALPADQRRFDLLVVTHVDQDHIEGIIKLLNDPSIDITFDDVWFNGYKHLESAALTGDGLGGMEGEYLSGLIGRRKFQHNAAFGGGPVMIGDDAATLPAHTLGGGLKLTLLSPTADALRALRGEWRETVEKHGIEAGDVDAALAKLAQQPRYRPGDSLGEDHSTDIDDLAGRTFRSDTSKANRSSIAFLAEYDGRSVILTGDAHAPVVADSVKRLLAETGGANRLKIDALKLSHHGSKADTSPDLLKLLDCPRFLFSSDGSRYHHPDGEAIAWVIRNAVGRPELHFNYLSTDNRRWAAPGLQRDNHYTAIYPSVGNLGSSIEL